MPSWPKPRRPRSNAPVYMWDKYWEQLNTWENAREQERDARSRGWHRGSIDSENAMVNECGDRIEALWGGANECGDGDGHGHIVTNDGVNAAYV